MLSDAQRAEILDEYLKVKTRNEYFANYVESRNGYQAVLIAQSKPMTLVLHLGCLILTLMSFGLGLIVWILIIYSKRQKSRILLEVTPEGKVTRRKLPNDDLR